MSLTYIDRFHPRQRRQRQADLDAGRFTCCDELDVLQPEHLRTLTGVSILLLIVGGILFIGLNIFAYYLQWHMLPRGFPFTLRSALLWTGINMFIYLLILPIHELIHGLVFLVWGGKPHFGAKLPVALYCGARNQLFRRNHYLAVGLAPLVIISLFFAIFTLLAPTLAPYTLFASIGNFAGAAGDVWVALRLLRLPSDVLIEDTEEGYRAWRLEQNQFLPTFSNEKTENSSNARITGS
ncbi:MAG: DUF3267 domain-containing protein [Ktedonobacteraceae bacterium]|nr:DUF3267 domain-containing protein [Ktedonobacteraceae bacterium]